jgi:hypothetical protein
VLVVLAPQGRNQPARPPLPYVANICRVDFRKVDWDVIYVASVLEACCKRLFKMFHLFQTYVASVFYLDAAYVSHLCCESMFEMFQLFQSYVAISVISGYCVCFIHLFQLYVPNVSSALIVCCIQVFHVSEVESHGGMAWAPQDGARQAVGRWSGHAAHLGSCGWGLSC